MARVVVHRRETKDNQLQNVLANNGKQSGRNKPILIRNKFCLREVSNYAEKMG